jgi:hypothetical protein
MKNQCIKCEKRRRNKEEENEFLKLHKISQIREGYSPGTFESANLLCSQNNNINDPSYLPSANLQLFIQVMNYSKKC